MGLLPLQAVGALEQLHHFEPERAIIHGDVKPANFLVRGSSASQVAYRRGAVERCPAATCAFAATSADVAAPSEANPAAGSGVAHGATPAPDESTQWNAAMEEAGAEVEEDAAASPPGMVSRSALASAQRPATPIPLPGAGAGVPSILKAWSGVRVDGGDVSVKIADLGCASKWRSGHAGSSYVMTSRSEGACDSLAFMAPELLVSESTEPTRASDVYAAGMMVYQCVMLAEPLPRGVAPLDRSLSLDENKELLAAAVGGGDRPDSTGLPAPLVVVLSAAWHSDPARRPSVRELRGKLQDMLDPHSALPASALLGPTATTLDLETELAKIPPSPSSLVNLAGMPAAAGNADGARRIAQALADIAASDAGRAACVAAGAPAALVALASMPAVRDSADAAQFVALALENVAASDAGDAACVAAGAPAALVALAGTPAVRGSADAAQYVAWALANVAASDAGEAACVAAGAPAALAVLASAQAVRGSADAAQYVAQALVNIAASDAGRAACVAAGAPAALVALAGIAPCSPSAARKIARAFANVAASNAGRAACVAAGAPAALVALAGTPAVRGSADAVQFVALALQHVAASDAGDAASACVAAGAPAALVALAGTPAVRVSADAAQHVAWALSNIAASVAGEAACVAAGAPAALVALAGTPAVRRNADAAQSVAQALESVAASDAGEAACVAAEPGVRGSADAAQYVSCALVNLTASDAGRDACVAAGAPAALVALAGMPAVRISADAVQFVAWALANIAISGAGRDACVAAGAPATLVALAGTPTLSADAAKYVAKALLDIAASDVGRAACVAAGAPAALVALAGTSAVRSSTDAAQDVAQALVFLSGSDAVNPFALKAAAAPAAGVYQLGFMAPPAAGAANPCAWAHSLFAQAVLKPLLVRDCLPPPLAWAVQLPCKRPLLAPTPSLPRLGQRMSQASTPLLLGLKTQTLVSVTYSSLTLSSFRRLNLSASLLPSCALAMQLHKRPLPPPAHRLPRLGQRTLVRVHPLFALTPPPSY